jgi:protein-disulfide isomerase
MEHNQSSKKTFFETYQNFFALIICGVLIGGGIFFGKLIQSKPGTENTQPAETQESVRADLISITKKLKLNKADFAACLDNETNKQRITDATNLAIKSGVEGTPTFFILKRTFDTNGKVVSEKQWSILGARSLADFEASIKNEKSPEGQPPITGDKIVLSDSDHYKGPENAEIVIVEYGDIDCYYCQKVKPTIEELLNKHPEYGFVYRHSPIVSLHPFAEYKAQAVECAYDQGNDEIAKEENFWKLLDIVTK